MVDGILECRIGPEFKDGLGLFGKDHLKQRAYSPLESSTFWCRWHQRNLARGLWFAIKQMMHFLAHTFPKIWVVGRSTPQYRHCLRSALLVRVHPGQETMAGEILPSIVSSRRSTSRIFSRINSSFMSRRSASSSQRAWQVMVRESTLRFRSCICVSALRAADCAS